MHTAQIGDRVRIQYSRLPQRAAARGVSHNQKTIEFTVGSRDVFPTVSVGVVGMAPGDRKQFTLQPDEAVIVDDIHALAGQVVELEVSLLTLDSSGHANKQKPQFDLGGQG